MSGKGVQARTAKGWFSLSMVLVALAGAATAAPARASDEAFTLGVEGGEAGLLDLAGVDAILFDGDSVHRAEQLLAESRDSWRSVTLQDGGAASGTGKKTGFGSWLKRRWYIPVLAAVALGVALGDDDDPAGAEDD